MERLLEDREVRLSDIETLRSNVAWRWLVQEWGEIKEELEQTLKDQEFPIIYRTQGRTTALDMVLTSLDNLEETLKGRVNGNE
jgi:hypothetical protein